MPYTLELTFQDRRAMDWIGDRYAHGDGLRRVLQSCETDPADAEWDSTCDVIFYVREAAAWEVQSIVGEDGLACFGPELAGKLLDFCNRVV